MQLVGIAASAVEGPGRVGTGEGQQCRAGPLHVRVLGSVEPVVLFLNGLAAAGSSFCAAYDQLAKSATVVVPASASRWM